MNNKTNQNIKKTHKFNIFDTVALIIVFVVALALFLWADPFDWIQTEPNVEEKTILYVVELKGIEKSKVSDIRHYDEVVFVTNGINMGRVVEIKKVPSLIWELPENGDQMILNRDQTKYTLFVTIEIDCSYQEGVGFFLDGEQLLVGKFLDIQFPMLETNAECVSITIKE